MLSTPAPLAVLLLFAIGDLLLGGAFPSFGPVVNRRRRRFVALKRFLEPLGKNLPFLSRGRLRASLLPLATRDALLRLRLRVALRRVRGIPLQRVFDKQRKKHLTAGSKKSNVERYERSFCS